MANLANTECLTNLALIENSNNTINDTFDSQYKKNISDFVYSSWDGISADRARGKFESMFASYFGRRWDEMHNYTEFTKTMLNGWEIAEKKNIQIPGFAMGSDNMENSYDISPKQSESLKIAGSADPESLKQMYF